MESVPTGAIDSRDARPTPLFDLWREFLYGEPGRAGPMLCLAGAALAAVVSRSPRVGLVTGGALLGAWSLAAPRLVIENQALGPVRLRCRRRDRSGRPLVWLTFDDGPTPHTEGVLDALEAEGVPATFFLVGERLQAWPDKEALAHRLAAGGHSVGNHTWSHPNLLTVSQAEMTEEIAATETLLGPLRGADDPVLFRPPFGYRGSGLFPLLERREATAVGWSVNSLDFLGLSARRIVERVIERLHPGAIVLLHDGPAAREETVRALPDLVRRIREAGYDFYRPRIEDLH